MKILYCLHGTFRAGGMERIVIAKANALAARGHEVIILTSEQNGRPDFFPLAAGVRRADADVKYYEAASLGPMSKFFVRRSKLRAHREFARQVIAAEKPDIVISTFGNEVGFIPEVAGGIPTVLEIHFSRYYRLQFRRPGLWKLIDRVLTYTDGIAVKRYDRFVTLTQADARNWDPKLNLTVIPNFITRFPAEPARLESLRVVAVGRFEPQKDYRRMVDVWEQVVHRHPEASLDIYGDGPCYDDILALIHKRDLADSIHLCGVTHDIDRVFFEASLFLHTASFEGFGLVLLEAMAAGLPVVSFDCPCGPSEIIQNGETGYLIPAGDNDAMVEEVDRLLSDPNLRRRLGAEAFKSARRFAPEAILTAWEKLLSSLCHR